MLPWPVHWREQEPGPQVREAVAAIEPWLDRFDAVLVGPGLGRDPLILFTVAEVGGQHGAWH